VRKGSGLASDEWTELSRGAKDGVIVIDVRRRREKMRRVFNSYNQREVRTGVAGKSVSHHHRHSDWQRTEPRRVYGDKGMTETHSVTRAYGDQR